MGRCTRKMAAIRRQTAALDFGQVQSLFSPFLRLPEHFGATKRNRLYSHRRVFWMFLSQVLAADGGCVATVQAFLAWLKGTEAKEASPATGAYCRARKDLPLAEVKALHAPLAEALDTPRDGFFGRRVVVVDGSSLSMPDTPANQQAWPQPRGQKPGCGFPVMRILGMFSLASGIWLGLASGALKVAERILFHRLWYLLEPDDITLADKGFASYADYVLLEQRGVDSVMLNHPCRDTGVREIRRLGKGDRLVEWSKGRRQPTWRARKRWEALPETFPVREITAHIDIPGFRSRTIVIVTTLRDHKAYPAHHIADLYRRRWAAELYFRDIKISMGADVLRCKTPAMVRKELWMHVLAYNLVRALMLDAARTHDTPLGRISFKGTCAAINHWAPIIAMHHGRRRELLIAALIRAIARNRVPYRPNRTEPRAKKRRPKNYQWLTEPRHLFKETPHRGNPRARRA